MSIWLRKTEFYRLRSDRNCSLESGVEPWWGFRGQTSKTFWLFNAFIAIKRFTLALKNYIHGLRSYISSWPTCFPWLIYQLRSYFRIWSHLLKKSLMRMNKKQFLLCKKLFGRINHIQLLNEYVLHNLLFYRILLIVKSN